MSTQNERTAVEGIMRTTVGKSARKSSRRSRSRRNAAAVDTWSTWAVTLTASMGVSATADAAPATAPTASCAAAVSSPKYGATCRCAAR